MTAARAPAADLSALELVERQRRARARAGEAGRGAVLAQQQPALGGRRVAAGGGLGDDVRRRGRARRGRPAGGGQRRLVVVAGRPARRLASAWAAGVRGLGLAQVAVVGGAGAHGVLDAVRAVEDELGLGVEEPVGDARFLPGASRRRPRGPSSAAAATNDRAHQSSSLSPAVRRPARPGRRSPRRCAAPRSRACRRRRRERLAALLLVQQAAGELVQLLLWSWSAAPGRVDLLDARLDPVVDQDDAAEDVTDIPEAGGRDEALFLGFFAGDEARVLPGLEVLRHRRRHHDHGGVRVLQVGLPLRPRCRAPSRT